MSFKWAIRIVLLILAVLALLSIPSPSGAEAGRPGPAEVR